jgi:D-beta-D-heptose 7-phosphate kinase/D-beta-D-heptose 1-phosphate adenosyltransferase
MKQLKDLVRRLAQARVLVVGDAMLDRYVFGQVDRVSPEAPVPVLSIDNELSEPGGAGNVVHNLCALGASVAFVSVVGDDQAGSELTGLIGGQREVEPWLLVQGGRVTTVKTRFVASGHRRGGQHLLRVDREDRRPIHPKLAERLQRIAREAMAATSITVLSDYRKGVLSGDVPRVLIAAAKAAGRRVIADLRAGDWAAYAGADVIVPHARDVVGDDGDMSGLGAACQALRAAHGIGAVLVKCGEAGFLLVDGSGEAQLPLVPADPVDLSGAGDAALAVLAAGMAAGADVRLASQLAAMAAGIVGGVPGSAVARPAQLLDAIGAEAASA